MYDTDLSGKNKSSKCKHANQKSPSSSFLGIFDTKKTIFPKEMLETGNSQDSDNYCSGTSEKADLIL